MKALNHFKLMKSPAEKYSYIIFSLDSSRPDCYIKELESELKRKSIVGTVLLDLLLANGNSSRRFFEVTFNGKSLNWMSAKSKPQSLVDTKVMYFCHNFYFKNKEVLSNGILTAVEKHKILSNSDIAPAY